MGCFGDMEETKQTQQTSTTSPAKWVQDAGSNLFQRGLDNFNSGFVPYTGQLTAGLTGNEKAASDLIGNYGTTNPYTGQIEGAYSTAGNAPAYNYDFGTVVDENGPLGSISSYMNPYIGATLDPTLRAISLAGAQARQGINANATSAGAFGDARHGIVESNQRKNEGTSVSDAVNRAYSDAFGSAMTNRQQDASRQFQTQQAQQSADEQALARMRQSGIDLTSLDQANTNRANSVTDELLKTGQNERGVQQAGLDADYQQFLRQQGWTDDQVKFLSQILGATPYETTTTGNTTVSEPNNSGWGIIGSLAGSALKMI